MSQDPGAPTRFKGLDIEFDLIGDLLPNVEEAKDVFEVAAHHKSNSEHKSLVNGMIAKYQSQWDKPEAAETRNILIELYLSYSTKKNFKKYVFDLFNTEKINDVPLLEYITRDVTEGLFQDLENRKIFAPKIYTRLLNVLTQTIQNFESPQQNDDFLEKHILLYSCILHIFTSQLYKFTNNPTTLREAFFRNEDCLALLDITFRNMIHFLTKTSHAIVTQYSLEFVDCLLAFLEFPNFFTYTTITQCSILMGYCLSKLPEDEKVLVKWKNCPLLDFLEHDELRLTSKTICNLFTSDKMKLILYCGITSAVHTDTVLTILIGETPLLEYLIENFVNQGEIMTGFPDQIILISKVLSDLSENMGKLARFGHLYEECLSFVWTHLEHFIEAVVHTTRLHLKRLIHWAVVFENNGEPVYLESLFQTINHMSPCSKTRLSALSIMSEEIDCQYMLDHFHDLQSYLLNVASDVNVGPIAGKIYMQLMERHLRQIEEPEFMAVWIKPLMEIVKQASMDISQVYQEIGLHAFKLLPHIYGKLFPTKRRLCSVEAAIFLRCIHYARTKSVTFSVDFGEETNIWRNLAWKRRLEMFMIHQDENVRILALQATVECQKSTEEIDEWEVLYFLSYFSYNVSTQLSAIRRRMCALFKKLLARFDASYNVLLRSVTNQETLVAKNPEDKSEMDILQQLQAKLLNYRSFLTQFAGLLHIYLSPDANYYRKSICLELMVEVHKIATREEWVKMFPGDEVTNIKQCLTDSYESNKRLGVALLKTFTPKMLGLDTEKKTKEFFDKCLSIACDIKPTNSLTACYGLMVVLFSNFPVAQPLPNTPIDKRCVLLNAILDRMKLMFDNNKDDVVTAARSTHFHGLLTATRNLIADRDIHLNNDLYRCLFCELTDFCLLVQLQILPVVCNDSPEGYCPSSETYFDTDLTSQAQAVVVYAWRTMKEITLLLAQLTKQTIALEDKIEMIPENDQLAIACFFVDLFIQSKHRGVFEQAYVGFSMVCNEFSRSRNPRYNVLPDVWLSDALDLSTGHKSDDRLCPTRRSAGLPFLVLSILSSQPDGSGALFRKTVERLLTVVKDSTDGENDEYRTHSMNILRFLFASSKLGDFAPAYLADATIAALNGFQSKVWGVRNSATLLYSALINRMFGVQQCAEHQQLTPRNRMTLAVFYVRYSKLFDFLLDTLGNECSKKNSLILHPVLYILTRLYPSHNDKTNNQVEDNIASINDCLMNPSYRTRELAARASICLITLKYLATRFYCNFTVLSNSKVCDAERHGSLLQIWYLLKTNRLLEALPVAECLSKSIHILEQPEKISDTTVVMYMEVIYLIIYKFAAFDDLPLLKRLLMATSRLKLSKISTSRSTFPWSRFKLLVVILLRKFSDIDTSFDIIRRELIGHLYADDTILQTKCLLFLIHLNQSCSKDEFKEHPLLVSGDIEIPETVRELCSCIIAAYRPILLQHLHFSMRCYLFAQMKTLGQGQSRDYFVLVLLLLSFYPCVFTTLHVHTHQEILDLFLDIASSSPEEVVSAVVSCLSAFLLTLHPADLKELNYARLIRLLIGATAPCRADYLRLAVAQFIVKTSDLCKAKYLNELERYNVFNIIMVLLEDEELIIRNTISAYSRDRRLAFMWGEVIPEKARSELMVSTISLFRTELVVCFLASWSMRHLPEASRDVSEIYDRGESNLYAENIPVIYAASKVLNGLVWPLGENLSYLDKSIFVEEQTLLLTTVAINALTRYPSPMVAPNTKRIVIEALKSIMKFIEDTTIGDPYVFRKNFKNFITCTIVKYLRENLKTDYHSVKYFLTYLYTPLTRANFNLAQVR